jgi:hypothetical protein
MSKFFLLVLAVSTLSCAGAHGERREHFPMSDHGIGKLRQFMNHVRSEYKKPYNFQTDDEIKRQERLKEVDSYKIY